MALPVCNMDLSYATSDVYYSQRGGLFRADYPHLLRELTELQKSNRLDQCYQDNVVEPFINYLLYQLKENRFNYIFSTHAEDLTDPVDKSIQSFLPVLAEALLQRNYPNHYYKSAFDDLFAFQAIVDTIFGLAVKHITTPMPPLVAWSRKEKGPFTITAAKIDEKIQIPIGVVCLPPEYRDGGLFAWSVMGHEVAGHNFIHAKPKLLGELTEAVKKGLGKKLKSQLDHEKINYDSQYVEDLSQYWSMSQRVEEVASDVLGILSTGPSLAIGCIGYFRGMSQDGRLKTSGPFEAKKKGSIIHIDGAGVDLRINDLSKKVEIKEPQGVIGKTPSGEELCYKAYKIPSGPHPVAALRPFAMVGAIEQTTLDQPSKKGWIQLIEEEIIFKEFASEKAIKLIKLDTQTSPPQKDEIEIPLEVARLSAEIVGNIIATTKIPSLGKSNISQLFNWSMKDEARVDFVRQSFPKEDHPPADVSASHIVAAAVMEASGPGADIEALFRKMKQYLTEVRGRVV